jgi:hypothetical protein
MYSCTLMFVLLQLLGCCGDLLCCAVQETMAVIVLFQFPCELLSAVVAGRWSAAGSPFIPWEFGYVLRLIAGTLMTTIVLNFPAGASDFSDHPPAFLAVLAAGLLTSFSSTLMFTSTGTFFNRISDPTMGGAYLTMLNTIMNVGMTLPQGIMFFLVDTLSYNVCEYASSSSHYLTACLDAPQFALLSSASAPKCPYVAFCCLLRTRHPYSSFLR